jgi:acetolactate synthase-1/2/3 large subunit
LATVQQRRLPIRILLFNNHCHGIQKQTLDTWLDGKYVGVDSGSGLAFPDLPRVAEAMGLRVITVDSTDHVHEQLSKVYLSETPVFCNVEINPEQKLHPFLRFGAPLEEQLPPMDDALQRTLMLIDSYVSSGDHRVQGTPGV